MFNLLLQRLAAGIRRVVPNTGRVRDRRALNAMLMFDDHLLRDIGLTRADVIECLSAPPDDGLVDCLDVRRKRNAAIAVRAPVSQRRAA